MTLGAAVRTGQLTVNEDGAAGILAAGRLRIRWNDAVGQRLDGEAFVGCEIMPWARPDRDWRAAGARRPRQAARDNDSPAFHAAEQQDRGPRQEVAPPSPW